MVERSQPQSGPPDEPDPTAATLARIDGAIANIQQAIVSGDMTQGVIADGKIAVVAGELHVVEERVKGLDRLVVDRAAIAENNRVEREQLDKEHRRDMHLLERDHRREIARMNEKALDAAFASNEKLLSSLNEKFQDIRTGFGTQSGVRSIVFAFAGLAFGIIGAWAATGGFGP